MDNAAVTASLIESIEYFYTLAGVILIVMAGMWAYFQLLALVESNNDEAGYKKYKQRQDWRKRYRSEA